MIAEGRSFGIKLPSAGALRHFTADIFPANFSKSFMSCCLQLYYLQIRGSHYAEASDLRARKGAEIQSFCVDYYAKKWKAAESEHKKQLDRHVAGSAKRSLTASWSPSRPCHNQTLTQPWLINFFSSIESIDRSRSTWAIYFARAESDSKLGAISRDAWKETKINRIRN